MADVGYWELQGYDRDAWVGRSNGYTSQDGRPQETRLRAHPSQFQS